MGAFFIIYYLLLFDMNFIRKLMIKTTRGPYWVMYDNECSFCYRITKRFKRFDIFDKIQLINKNWSGDFPSEGRKRIEDTVVVYNPIDDALYYKSEAISKIIQHFKITENDSLFFVCNKLSESQKFSGLATQKIGHTLKSI